MGLYKALAATVIINCLVKGTLKSLGVLMLELDSLGVDTTTASWIPAIAYTLFSVMSTPVAKYEVVVSQRLQIFLFQTGVVVVSQVHVTPGLSYHRLWCPPLLLASPPSPDPGSGSVSGHWRMCLRHHRSPPDQQTILRVLARSGARVQLGWEHSGRSAAAWTHCSDD